MKTIVGIVVLGLVVSGVYVLNGLTRTRDGKSMLHVAPELDIPVEAANPEQHDIVRTVQAPGEVEAFAEVGISSEVVGKILEMPVEEGDFVHADDLLCRLDDAVYRARVLAAEADVAKLRAAVVQAESQVEKAELDYSQELRLVEKGASSSDSVAQLRTVLVGARAVLDMRNQELVSAQAGLESSKQDLAKTVITAPLDGVVAQRFAKQGEVVITGTMNNPGTRIMVITDLSKMQVRCRVDEADAALVASEQPARIFLQSDTHKSIPGSVLRLGTKGTRPLGRDVVTFETLVLITGDDPRVKPGMTANVEIEVARRDNALTIPVQAVVYRKRGDLPAELVKQLDAQQDAAKQQSVAAYVRLVFCVTNGKAAPHAVETGINDANRVEITNGLELADTIITGPYRSLDQLKEGAAVKCQEKPAGPAKPPEENVVEKKDETPTTSTAQDEKQDKTDQES